MFLSEDKKKEKKKEKVSEEVYMIQGNLRAMHFSDS